MRGSIRQRRPGVWTLTVEAGRDPKTGKRRRVYRDVHGGKRYAEEELALLLGQYAADELPEISGRTSVAEWLELWLDHWKAESASPKTLERYREIVDHNIAPAIGRYRLRDLRPEHVQALYRQLGKDGMGEGGRRKVIAVLKAALNKARDLGAVTRNAADGVEFADYRPPEIRVLNEREIAKLVAAAKESSSELLYPAVVVALTTGLRRGELLALKWEDIDFEAKTLTVRRSLEQTRHLPSELPSAGLRLKVPKTRGSRRTIGLMDETLAVLDAVKKEQAQTRWKLRSELVELAPARAAAIARAREEQAELEANLEAVLARIDGPDPIDAFRLSVEMGLPAPVVDEPDAMEALYLHAEIAYRDFWAEIHGSYTVENVDAYEGFVFARWAEAPPLILAYGAPYMPTTLSVAFERLAKRIGIQCRFHDLRHTHASQLMAAGVPATDVAHRLGHANAATTLRIYAHFIPGGPDRAVQALEERLGPALSESMRKRSGGTKATNQPK